MGVISLYLMTSKGEAVLDAALDFAAEISCVVTSAAVGMNDDAHTSISMKAKAAGIPTFLRACPPEFEGAIAIAAGWRWLFDHPQLVVLHDSLLPRYRGFSPLVTALVNGETEVGVTAFLAREEPDTGPIIGQRSIPITYPARVKDVIARLESLYYDLTVEILREVPGQIRYYEQDHSKATYSVWRDHHDYEIDWSKDDRSILRLIDAVSDPFPGATTKYAGNRVRVLEASIVPDVTIEDRRPGKIFRLDGIKPIVVCGQGLLRIDDLRGFDYAMIPVERLKERFG